MGNVTFVVRAQKGVDLDTLEELLRENDFGTFTKLRSTNELICDGSRESYAATFGVELLHDPTKNGVAGYTVSGYKEIGTATIPNKWKDQIVEAHLLYPSRY